MLALGIETAGEVAGIALVNDNGVISEHIFRHHQDLTRRLIPNIARLIEDSGITREEIGLIAVSIGPGSFTGLRIGVTTAKTLAQSLGCGVAAIPTLEALAKSALGVFDGVVCATLHARKSEYFTSVYRQTDSSLETILSDEVFSLEGLAEKLNELDLPVLICGEAVSRKEELLPLVGKKIKISEPWEALPRAATIASLGLERQQEGKLDDLMALAPRYTRPSQAEARLAQGRLAWDKK